MIYHQLSRILVHSAHKSKCLNWLDEFYHLTKDAEEVAQFCFKNEDDDEYEYDDKNDAQG